MKHLIDKDALVAEIEELKTAIDIKLRSSNDSAYWKAQSLICERLEFKVNSLEVKGVDLEKEIENCLKKHSMLAVGKKDFTDIAKHFFELGLKAQKGE